MVFLFKTDSNVNKNANIHSREQNIDSNKQLLAGASVNTR